MPTWFTSRPCWPAGKSHISHVVFDETWEASEAYRIENNPDVTAWVKNDHLGYGMTLVLEVKGREKEKDRVKRQALKEWVETVNEYGEFGQWACDISYHIADVDGIIRKWMAGNVSTIPNRCPC